MGGYIDQQWLLATGRVQHELVQSADYIYRQLKLRSEHVYSQSSQVEGRIHRELLQKAGNLQYQLLMASSLPSYYGQPDVSRDVSPSADADNGRQEAPSQYREGCPQGTLPQHGDRRRQDATSRWEAGGDATSHNGDNGCQDDTSQEEAGGRHQTLLQHGGEDLHGAKERRQEE